MKQFKLNKYMQRDRTYIRLTQQNVEVMGRVDGMRSETRNEERVLSNGGGEFYVQTIRKLET